MGCGDGVGGSGGGGGGGGGCEERERSGAYGVVRRCLTGRGNGGV